MAQVLTAIPLHGLEAVLVAVELALQSGRVSAEHVLNVLSRLQERDTRPQEVPTTLVLAEPPQANVVRYNRLRSTNSEDEHVQ